MQIVSNKLKKTTTKSDRVECARRGNTLQGEAENDKTGIF